MTVSELSEPTTTQGKTIEDRIENRVRDAGLPVLIGDEIRSKRIRNSVYLKWEAKFVLYGEDNAKVMSYDIQVDEAVKEAIKKHAANSINNRAIDIGIGYRDIEQIIKTTNYDASRFCGTSFSWYEDPARINGVNADFVKERELNTEHFKDIALIMEEEFHGKTRRELEEKYGFILVPVVSMDGQETNRNPTGLKVTYQLAE